MRCKAYEPMPAAKPRAAHGEIRRMYHRKPTCSKPIKVTPAPSQDPQTNHCFCCILSWENEEWRLLEDAKMEMILLYCPKAVRVGSLFQNDRNPNLKFILLCFIWILATNVSWSCLGKSFMWMKTCGDITHPILEYHKPRQIPTHLPSCRWLQPACYASNRQHGPACQAKSLGDCSLFIAFTTCVFIYIYIRTIHLHIHIHIHIYICF